MKPVDIIRKKRFGETLNEQEIRYFINGVVTGEFEDYQSSALLMAICTMGMTDRETLALTVAMEKSGQTLDLSDIPGVKADKHSTGGVGDTTTLILVPLVACCGVKMAKMSGRGLGFTGGTLDKLESIPGMRTDLSIDQFKGQVADIGCAVIGQSAELAPADKALYSLRDVTGTVDSMPLIVSSILSKKLAAGCDVVVLDVKYGSGSLAGDAESARALAELMVRIGQMSGRKFSALVTDMDQPLGGYIGNALEVEEAIGILSGKVEGDLKTVSLELGAHILRNSGVTRDIATGVKMLDEKIKSGEGLKRLSEMIRAQGGNYEVVYDTSLLPKAQKIFNVRAMKEGFVSKIATDSIGNAAKLLGAGRQHKGDTIDPTVGVVIKKRIGDGVNVGDILCEVHANAASDVSGALGLLNNAFTIALQRPEKGALIKYVV